MTSIVHRFKDAAQTFARRTAVQFFRAGILEIEKTYADLFQDVERFRKYLVQKAALRKSDRVLMLMDKSVASVVAHLALMASGAVAVPLNPGFKRHELTYLIADADPALILADPDRAGIIRTLAPDLPILEIPTACPLDDLDRNGLRQSDSDSRPACSPDDTDPALMIYTSGTTGHPKGALLSHGNLMHDAENIVSAWEISSHDVICHALPLFHIHGLCFALHTALVSGSGLVLLDRFDPDIVLQRLGSKDPANRCSVFMAVPAMYTRLLDAVGGRPLDLDHIRLFTSGSAPLPEKEFERIRDIFGKEPVEREGMSETGVNFTNPLHGIKKPGSIGMPLPGVRVHIVHPDTGQDVKPGDVGEIRLKSPSIIREYWRKPEETRRAFEDGWFKTGDLGRVDRDGYYYLTDRIKHVIITGGENVSPKEVESVISRVPGVAEVSVVGLPDPVWGERVAALVRAEPGSGLTASDIRNACKKSLHDWKCPKEVRFSDHVPRNTMGKVLKETVKTYFTKRESRS